MNSDLDAKQLEGASQLSAMFDGELTAAECELLSRRLGRDDQLRGRWARYALIGAALRSEPVAAVSGDFSRRVGSAIDAGSDGTDIGRRARRRVWAMQLRRYALGGALVASVAAAGIFVLRNQMLMGGAELTAYMPTVQRLAAPAALTPSPQAPLAAVTAATTGSSHEPASYVVPPSGAGSGAGVPAALANYVVAHSEYSSPLVRSSLISSLMASESTAPVAAAEEGEVILSGDNAP